MAHPGEKTSCLCSHGHSTHAVVEQEHTNFMVKWSLSTGEAPLPQLTTLGEIASAGSLHATPPMILAFERGAQCCPLAGGLGPVKQKGSCRTKNTGVSDPNSTIDKHNLMVLLEFS